MQSQKFLSLAAVIVAVLSTPSCLFRNAPTPSPISPPADSVCEITLFRNNKRVDDYYDRLKQIIPPCTLVFSNTSLSVTQKLGSGGGSVIFKTTDEQVVRIAKNPLQENDLRDFKNIYEDLLKNQVPVVQTRFPDQKHLEYILHERLNIAMTLKKFTRREGFRAHSNIMHEKVYMDFLTFSETTSPYIFIADLHDENIVQLTDGRWLAMDFGASDPLKYSTYANQIFVRFKPDPKHLARAQVLLRKHHNMAQIFAIAKKEKWFEAFSQNVFTDLDPNVLSAMHLPQSWQMAIREGIFKTRLLKSATF